MGGIKILPLQNKNIEKLFSFRAVEFPQNDKQLDTERWKWLYLENPNIKGLPIPVWVMSADNEYVGSISSIPLFVKVGQEKTIISFGSDYFVNNKYLGLPALRLLKTMQKQYEINIGANLSDSAKKLFLKMGYIDLSSSIQMATIFIPVNAKKRSIKSLIKYYFYSLYRKVICNKKYFVCLSCTTPESTNDLWDKVESKINISIVKDFNYIKWRYEKCPSINYSFLTLGAGNDISAMAIITILEDSEGVRRGMISDMLVDPDNSDSIYQILHECITYFKKSRCSSCFTHFMDVNLTKYFRALGFTITQSDLGLMVLLPKIKSNEQMKLITPKKWSFWLGDTDRY